MLHVDAELTRPCRLLVGALLIAVCGCGEVTDSSTRQLATPEQEDGPLVLAAPVHHLDVFAREPMVVQHPSGALFVAGYGSQVTGLDPDEPPNLWRSDDSGATWQHVDVGGTADGAAGNSDVDLAVAPDGTLYFVAMGFDRSVRQGTHVAIGVSHDVGASWSWSRVSETRFDDRPWARVGPDGTVHAVWNDDHGVSYAVSTDRGATWTERDRIHHEGGSSHLAVGPAGEIAVRIGSIAASGNVFTEGVDLVAVSVDGGVTWDKREVPGQRVWDRTLASPDLIPRWVEPVAWDAAGDLHYLWSEGTTVRLGSSGDHGSTWTTRDVADERGTAYYPYLVARNRGELAATWFSGREDTVAVNLALTEVPEGGDGELRVRRSAPFKIDAWLESEESPSRTPGGEYVPVVFLVDGRLGVATPIQDLARDRWGFSWWTTEQAGSR